MKKYLNTINNISMYLSVALVLITLAGYLLSITVICASLLVLIRTCVLTGIKFVIYFGLMLYKNTVQINLLSINGEFI